MQNNRKTIVNEEVEKMNQQELIEAKAQRIAAEILGEKVKAFEELIAIQEKSLGSDYQNGLYNGLVLGKSLLTGKEPQFYQPKGEKEDDKES